MDLLVANIQANKGASTQKFLKEKENAIQLWKKKLSILATQLIQTFELTEIEKEKSFETKQAEMEKEMK